MNISNRLISTAARQRAAALLKELSLEEKVRQLGCTMLVSEDTDLTAKDLPAASAKLPCWISVKNPMHWLPACGMCSSM